MEEGVIGQKVMQGKEKQKQDWKKKETWEGIFRKLKTELKPFKLMNIFLCFYILLKFPGRHPRSPCSYTLESQPQSLPVYCLIRIICSRSWVQYVSLLLWIKLSPVSKCIIRLPQKGFPFSPQILLSVKSECLVHSSGSSIPPVAQLELISAASVSPAAAIPPEIPDFVMPR